MSLQSLLAADTATLERPTVTKDASGGQQRATWSEVAAGVPCRVEDLSANAQLVYLQQNMLVTHLVTTQNGDGRVGDRWVTSDGRNLLVHGAMKVRGMGSIQTYYEYQCEELRPGA